MRPASYRIAALALAIIIANANATEEEVDPQIAKITAATQKRLRDRTLYFRGERIFDRMCVQCHGTTGRGNGPWSIDMTTKPRNLRTGTFKFRTTPYGKLPTEQDLRRTIRTGISGTAMPTFAKFTDAELDGIVAFVQSLSRRWKDEKNYALPIALPEAPAWLKDKKQITKHAAAGEPHFRKLCTTCHGESGKGDGIASKGLIDIWKNPIAPADLTKPHLKSGPAPNDIYRTIATGLDGTPMIGFDSALKPPQIWDLVAYIRSLQPTD